MFQNLARIAAYISLVLAIALAASSCGRRGALEAPPSSSVIQSDSSGEVVEEETVEDNPFILDALL